MRKVFISMLVVLSVFLVLGICDVNRIASESNQKRYKAEINEISVDGYKTINNASKSDTGDSVKPVVMEIVTVTETPEPTPYPDFDLEHLSVISKEGQRNDSSRVESVGESAEDNGSDEGSESVNEGFNESGSGSEPVNESDSGYFVEVEGSADEADPLDRGGYEEDSVSELVESEPDYGVEAGPNGDEGFDSEADAQDSEWTAGLTYLGDWTITAYCPCEICCGVYSSGYTASGTLATAGRTIACNDLPIGAQVMIDDCVYTVEDTGLSPYDNWIDIYFDSHDEALAYGMQIKEVYLVG